MNPVFICSRRLFCCSTLISLCEGSSSANTTGIVPNHFAPSNKRLLIFLVHNFRRLILYCANAGVTIRNAQPNIHRNVKYDNVSATIRGFSMWSLGSQRGTLLETAFILYGDLWASVPQTRVARLRIPCQIEANARSISSDAALIPADKTVAGGDAVKKPPHWSCHSQRPLDVDNSYKENIHGHGADNRGKRVLIGWFVMKKKILFPCMCTCMFISTNKSDRKYE